MLHLFYIIINLAILSLYPTPGSALPAKLIVKNALIFSMAANQIKPFTGYLVIANDETILKVGEGSPAADMHAATVVDAHGMWLIPGFVSAHSHLWQAAYRGLAADKTLNGWLDDLYDQRVIRTKPEDLYWFCLLGSMDHLQHGITSAYNFSYNHPVKDNAFDEAQFRAVSESGLRFIHGYLPEKVNDSVSYEDMSKRLKAFLDWTAQQPKSATFLGVMINGLTAFNTTHQQAVMEAALMKQFNMSNQSHYLESAATQDEERAKFKWFAESGLLSSKLFFGHFIHSNEFILQQTAKAGTAMSWNPLSNGRLASGIVDIPKYLKLGIHVGMGVDGEASADLADPFENMRVGLYLVRAKYEDATVMSPYQMLWLHTMGSAQVLQLQNKIGSLEVGKFGDFLLINPARLGAVLEDPYANLVLVTGERDIEQVYVGGKLLVNNNHIVLRDIATIQREVGKRVVATSKY